MKVNFSREMSYEDWIRYNYNYYANNYNYYADLPKDLKIKKPKKKIG